MAKDKDKTEVEETEVEEYLAKCIECGMRSVDFIQMKCLYCGKQYTDRDEFFDKNGIPKL